MSFPMITFSFSPISGSILPLVAASVRTRAVSWKEAALRKESVASEALVIPSRVGRAWAGSLPSAMARAFSSSNSNLSTSWPGRDSVSPASSVLHPLDPQGFVRVDRALGELVARLHAVPLGHAHAHAVGHGVGLLAAVLAGDDNAPRALGFADADLTRRLGDDRLPLGAAGLEELLHTRQGLRGVGG